MKNNLFKKSVALVMTVMMLMTCWVFMPATHEHLEAEALEAASSLYNKNLLNGINTNVDYVIVTGSCHADCFEALSFGYDMYALARPERYDYVEGYVCSDGQFVDRYEAAEIAYNANQISQPLSILYSEDVWPE